MTNHTIVSLIFYICTIGIPAGAFLWVVVKRLAQERRMAYLQTATALPGYDWPSPSDDEEEKRLARNKRARELNAMRRQEEAIWKTKDGKEIPLKELSDMHLANALKMVARNRITGWANKQETTYERGHNLQSLLLKNPSFKKLYHESMTRKFQITFLDKTHDNIRDQDIQNCIEVFVPPPKSKLDPRYTPSDWDSRCDA